MPSSLDGLAQALTPHDDLTLNQVSARPEIPRAAWARFLRRQRHKCAHSHYLSSNNARLA